MPEDQVIDSEVIDAINSTAKLCKELGHKVEMISPELDTEALGNAVGIIISANVALTLDMRAQQLGRELKEDDVEHITYRMYKNGKIATSDQYAHATLVNHQAGRALGHFMENYDVILSPVLNKPPVKIGSIDMSSKDVSTYITNLLSYSGFTGLYNQTGQPSISVPLSWSNLSLPIGSMFSAKFGEDALLLSLAAQLENAKPWKDKKPPIYSSV